MGLSPMSASLASAAQTVQNPQSDAVGIQGKIPSAPPKTGATISTPGNGQTFTKTPITVAGLCPKGLLVKIFSNNVFVGSVQCTNGSYTIQVDLFSGRNDLVARVFDAFDQAGPDSNIVTVTFNDAQFNPLGGPLLTLTSAYSNRGANPGATLTWPFILSGGVSPYAITIDWGDGKTSDLISRQFTGTFDTTHVYDNAGIYRVVIRATDKNGLTAYLQVVATANGAVIDRTQDGNKVPGKSVIKEVMWIPAAATVPLLFVSFWLGRKFELAALRKHLEQHH